MIKSEHINPVILAIDTADEITGIALVVNSEILTEQNAAVKKGRDTVLSEMTGDALKSCGFTWNEINAVAINCGPGSFTGLRVGMAYAKGICYSKNIPLICVDNFQALALSAGRREALIAPVIHARADEVYAAIYKYRGDDLITVLDGDLYEFKEFAVKLKERIILLGSGFRRHRSEFINMLEDRLIIHQDDNPVSSAIWVAKIGLKKYLQGDFEKTGKTEPSYLQDFPRLK